MFGRFADDDLDDIARAIYAADGEGEGCSTHVQEAIVAEYESRDRQIPRAYDRGTCDPQTWLALLHCR
jgi:hypothetical protein